MNDLGKLQAQVVNARKTFNAMSSKAATLQRSLDQAVGAVAKSREALNTALQSLSDATRSITKENQL